MVRNFKNDPYSCQHGSTAPKVNPYICMFTYRYHVINIYKQRMFLVQSNLFLLSFFLFIVYFSRLLTLIILSSLFLFFFLLENNIFFLFLSLSLSLFSSPPSLSHVPSPLFIVHVNKIFSLINYCICVRRLSPRLYTLMKKSLFTINSPWALSHSSLYISTLAYICFTHVFSLSQFGVRLCVYVCVYVYVYEYVYMSMTCFISRINLLYLFIYIYISYHIYIYIYKYIYIYLYLFSFLSNFYYVPVTVIIIVNTNI